MGERLGPKAETHHTAYRFDEIMPHRGSVPGKHDFGDVLRRAIHIAAFQEKDVRPLSAMLSVYDLDHANT